MKIFTKLSFSLFFFLFFSLANFSQNSNYIYESGTLWYAGFYDILKASDESVFDTSSYKNLATALMWDRTANNGNGAWTEPLSWIYTIRYQDNVTAEVRVRQIDYTKTEANEAVSRYSDYLGRLPFVLRNGIKLINIMTAEANFGGNNWNNSIDIYEGTLSETLLRDGNMEEMLLHEGTHAALDYLYNENWIVERNKDAKFISKYAYENPNREDISETFAVWLAVRNIENRLSADDYTKVTEGLSNRIAYLNSLNFNISPIEGKSLSIENFTTDTVILYPNPVGDEIKIISTTKDAKAFVIYNAIGVKVLEGILNINKEIPFKQFAKGVYFLKLNNQQKLQFIKN